jgi:hypothetical protein
MDRPARRGGMIDGVSVGAGAAGWIDARARPADHRPIGYGAGGCRGASDRDHMGCLFSALDLASEIVLGYGHHALTSSCILCLLLSSSSLPADK